MLTSALIEDFAQFAREQVHQRGEDFPIDDLFDEWRMQHPPAEDWQAIKASLRDLENGETGRPFEEFAAEFRQRNIIRDTNRRVD